MSERGFSDNDFIDDWLEVPYTTPQITELRNKLTFWSFITLILALSNVEITTLFFIQFVDPIEKEQILPFVWVITIYYFSFWLTRLVEYLLERKASEIVAQFMELEDSLARLKGNTGMLNQREVALVQPMIRQYAKGKERVEKVKMARLLAFIAFDILVPSVVIIGALTLTVQNFCIS